MIRKPMPLLLTVGAAVWLLGCGPSAPAGNTLLYSDGGALDSAGAAQLEGTIGSAGGTLAASSGALVGLTLTFPAGAVTADTPITCVEITSVDKPLYAAAGPALSCTPEDLTFSKPFALALPYDDALLPENGGPAALSILHRAANGEVYVIDDITADLNAKTIHTTVYSLGAFQCARVAPSTTKG